MDKVLEFINEVLSDPALREHLLELLRQEGFREDDPPEETTETR